MSCHFLAANTDKRIRVRREQTEEVDRAFATNMKFVVVDLNKYPGVLVLVLVLASPEEDVGASVYLELLGTTTTYLRYLRSLTPLTLTYLTVPYPAVPAS